MSSVAPPDAAGGAGGPVPPTPPEPPTQVLPAAEPGVPAGPPRFAALSRFAPLLTTLGVALALAGTTFVQGSGAAPGPRALTELLLVLGGAALVIAALLRLPAGARLDGVVTVALFASLAGLTAVSITWAVDPAGAWGVANRLFAYVAAFAGAAALARTAPRLWPSMLGGIVLTAGLVCGYGLLTKALPAELSEFSLFSRLREPYGYWNAVGLAGVMAIPACMWLGARRDGPPLLNALAYPVLSMALAATLMAYSRGALAAALAGLLVWFALVPLRLRAVGVLLIGGAGALMLALWSFGKDALTTDRAPLDDRAAAGTELLVLLVVVLVLVYAAGLITAFLADSTDLRAVGRRRIGVALLAVVALLPFAAAGALASTDEGLGGSISSAWGSLTSTEEVGPANDPSRLVDTGSTRGRYWQAGFDMWRGDEVRGIGAGGYATGYLRHRLDLLDVRHAHGFVPETLAELGLIGLALSFALLVAWLLAARRAVRGARAVDVREHAGLVTLVSVALIFGAHSLIDFTWAIPGVALVGIVAAGWVAGRNPGAVPALVPDRSPARWGAAALVAVIALAVAWSVWQPLLADRDAEDSVTALQEGKLDLAREKALSAADHNPLSVEPLLDLAAVEARANRRAQAEQALVDATELQPANWLPWMRLTDYRLFELKDPDGAMEAVRRAIYLNPQSWDVAQRYLDVRRAQAAAEKQK